MRRALHWLANLAMAAAIAAVYTYAVACMIEQQRAMHRPAEHGPCWDERYQKELPPIYGTDC